MIILQQMTIFFLIMGIGYICGKKRFFSDEGVGILSFIVINIANPALVISSGAEGADFGLSQILVTLGVAVLTFLLLIALSFPVGRLLGGKQEAYPIYRVMFAFSNIGFMGMPLLSAVYGPESVLYASLFLFPYNILLYTYGVTTLQNKGTSSGSFLKKIINMGSIACVISLTIFLGHIKVPEVLLSCVKSLGNMTAPLSMMVIGYSLSKIAFRELFLDPRLLVFAGVKQLLLPLAAVPLLRVVIPDLLLLKVLFIILSMPVGSMVAMFAGQYSENDSLASRGVALTTLLSIVTIPLLSQITGL
ncbi:MAG: AEC family transporter [Lachnospiraceae bacterium]|nr:AEC family transporter [Lachnospiraceae bacterium]